MRNVLAVLVAAIALCFPSEASARRVRVHRGWHAQARALKAAPIKRVAVLQESSESALVEAGRRWGVASLRTGQPHPVLQAAAEEHAEFQARWGQQGHQNWDARKARIWQQMPGVRSIEEVANESWPGQDEAAAANEMFRSWRTSSGHWGYVNGRCRYWGYAMVLGRNRTWYACGIFAD